MNDTHATRKKTPAHQTWIVLVILYVTGLQAIAGLAVIKTDLVDRMTRKLSAMVSPPEPMSLPLPLPLPLPVIVATSPPAVRDYQKELVAITDRDLFVYPLYTQLALMNLVPPNPVFFVGDSMVRGLNVSELTPFAVNLGLSGDNTAGTLYRIRLYPKIMPHFQTSKLLVIAVGINNLGLGAPADSLIATHIRLMLASRPANQRVVLNALFPVDEAVNPIGLSGYNQRIDAINQELRRICVRFANCAFLDAGRDMRDGRGNLAKRYHREKDAFHLSPAAYAIWIEKLRGILTKPDPLTAEEQQIGEPLPATKGSTEGPN